MTAHESITTQSQGRFGSVDSKVDGDDEEDTLSRMAILLLKAAIEITGTALRHDRRLPL